MLALRTSPPELNPTDGEAVAGDLYGVKAASVHCLSGERDRNFLVRTAEGTEYVLKVFHAAHVHRADCLVKALLALAANDAGLTVPAVHRSVSGAQLGSFSRNGDHYGTCLVDFLPGRLLLHAPRRTGLLGQLGEQLGRLDRALRGFFHPALAPRLAWDLRCLPELAQHSGLIRSLAARAAVLEVADRLREHLPRLGTLRAQAIHGDCHARNVLVDEAGTRICGILDFGDVMHAPLVFDPAIAMSELLLDELADLQGVAEFLRGFVSRQALESVEVDCLHELICARHAITLLVHAWRAEHDPAGAEALADAAPRAAASLQHLLSLRSDALNAQWHDAAGTRHAATRVAATGVGETGVGETRGSGIAALAKEAAQDVIADEAAATALSRRVRLLGSGAELFYRTPLHLVRGQGVWLYDPAGRPYLDAYNNVPHVGHAHPTVAAAVARQTAMLATHTRYLHAGVLDYAEALTATLPAQLNACVFVNSGSEANDVAWRIAKLLTGNGGALVVEHAYHGITDAVGALTPGTAPPRDPWVVTLAAPPAHLRAGDSISPMVLEDAARDADAAIARLAHAGFRPAAFFMDSALTSSGILDPPPAWLEVVTSRVRAAGGIVVADEVQYGLGRSGSHLWGFARRGASPDIVTLGKPVGNGYPMGVVIADRPMIEALQTKFGLFSTFGGNAVAAAAGLAVLDVLGNECLMLNAGSTGDYLRCALISMAETHRVLGSVRGCGLLLGVEILGADAADARRRCADIVNAMAADHRVLIGSEGAGGNILKLRPPMPFDRQHADLLLQALDAATQVVAKRSL